MMKRILSVILAFVMIVLSTPSMAFATDIANTDSLYKYEINDGEVTITKYIGNETDVEIPSEIEGLPVTAIGEQSFYECSFLEHVFIPGSVKEIGKEAFCGCDSLKKIVISDGVETIGESAFKMTKI